MADYIEYPLPIRPIYPLEFAILEDIFLKGSLRILEKEEDKESIPSSACKQGMLVRCIDSNKFYILSKYSTEIDEWGDEIPITEWTEFKVEVENVENRVYKPSRFTVTISSLFSTENEVITSIPVARACIVSKVFVDTNDVDFTMTETLVDSSLAYPYETFVHEIKDESTIANRDMTVKPFSFLDGTVLNTRYTNILTNKDLNSSKSVYFKIKRKSSSVTKVKTTFTIIRIEGDV